MQEVYVALYGLDENRMMRAQGEEQVIAPARVDVKVSDDCMGCGSGWRPYAEILLERCGKTIAFDADALPQAEFVAVLAEPRFERGDTVSPTEALPVYVRHDVARRKPKSRTV